MGIYLGIDTSNYSSSVAVLDSGSGQLIFKRKLLPVEKGKVGLRQSDAVFSHVKQLAEVVRSVFDDLCAEQNLSAIGVSIFPRRAEGSYMPCFLVGKLVAESISAVTKKPIYTFSHQEGHVAAALYSSNSLHLMNEEFVALHISGGTSEILRVSPDVASIIRCEKVASTLDLNAGQLIDRVGNLLGCGFPAGPELEKLALKCNTPISVTATMKGFDFCLSGVENQCANLVKKDFAPAYVARFCIENITAVLDQSLKLLSELYGSYPVVFSGGVMSNSIIQSHFKNRKSQFDSYFAEPALSSDNAAGVALLAKIKDEYHE